MDVEAGPSSKGPASRDREARQICRTFRDEQYEMDEIANAVCDGGLSAGYAVFLQKFENFTLPGVPRIWINAPKSQEYQERQECFEKAYLEHLKRIGDSPFKYTRANPFLDGKVNEHLGHGVSQVSRLRRALPKGQS